MLQRKLPATKFIGSLPLMAKILESIRALHVLLNVTKQFKKADADLLSFDVADLKTGNAKLDSILISKGSQKIKFKGNHQLQY